MYCRKMVCNKLRRIGEGCWLQDGSTDWLSADSKAGCDGLDLWRSKWYVCSSIHRHAHDHQADSSQRQWLHCLELCTYAPCKGVCWY
jgi:hypothetical protein